MHFLLRQQRPEFGHLNADTLSLSSGHRHWLHHGSILHKLEQMRQEFVPQTSGKALEYAFHYAVKSKR